MMTLHSVSLWTAHWISYLSNEEKRCWQVDRNCVPRLRPDTT